MPSEFSLRSDSVDVEQIMEQIRGRIREKRGVDYTEDELRELAKVKLETFLDPTRVRSDLLEHYRSGHRSDLVELFSPAPVPGNFTFDDHLVFGSARGVTGRFIAGFRKLLNPILKLFINPNPIIQVLHLQGQINTHNADQFGRIAHFINDRERARADLDLLNYEVLHNLVLEMTRLGIEVKNLKMRVESLSSRLDFNERRARALEHVVQYQPGAGPVAETGRSTPPSTLPPDSGRGPTDQVNPAAKGEAQRSRRRRRRRGRGAAGGGPQGPTEANHQEQDGRSGPALLPLEPNGRASSEPASDPSDPGATDQ